MRYPGWPKMGRSRNTDFGHDMSFLDMSQMSKNDQKCHFLTLGQKWLFALFRWFGSFSGVQECHFFDTFYKNDKNVIFDVSKMTPHFWLFWPSVSSGVIFRCLILSCFWHKVSKMTKMSFLTMCKNVTNWSHFVIFAHLWHMCESGHFGLLGPSVTSGVMIYVKIDVNPPSNMWVLKYEVSGIDPKWVHPGTSIFDMLIIFVTSIFDMLIIFVTSDLTLEGQIRVTRYRYPISVSHDKYHIESQDLMLRSWDRESRTGGVQACCLDTAQSICTRRMITIYPTSPLSAQRRSAPILPPQPHKPFE